MSRPSRGGPSRGGPGQGHPEGLPPWETGDPGADLAPDDSDRGAKGRRARVPAPPPPDPGRAEEDFPGGDRGSRSGRGGPSARPARGQRNRRRGPNRVLLGGLALALVAAGAGSYLLLSGGQQPARRAVAGPSRPPSSAPATPSTAAAPPGPWKFIQSRATDPQPLTLTELFPKQFTVNGDSATMTIDKQGTHCSAAILGATLGTAVIKGHCTQVLRATYLSASTQLMGTIGVLNLATVADAERAGKASGATEFIDPLPAASGPTRNIKKGTGIEEAEFKGHYLILIWAEFADLHSPSTAARRVQLEQFAADLINGTANVSLTSRMVTGKPH